MDFYVYRDKQKLFWVSGWRVRAEKVLFRQRSVTKVEVGIVRWDLTGQVSSTTKSSAVCPAGLGIPRNKHK